MENSHLIQSIRIIFLHVISSKVIVKNSQLKEKREKDSVKQRRSTHQDKNDKAQQQTDKDYRIDNGEPVNLKERKSCDTAN